MKLGITLWELCRNLGMMPIERRWYANAPLFARWSEDCALFDFERGAVISRTMSLIFIWIICKHSFAATKVVNLAYEAKVINEGSQRICGFQGSPAPGGKSGTEARFGPRPLR
jgi:hypothetical protein